MSHTAALIGGFAGFAAQWLIFEKGNFSETSGEVFIPMLGLWGAAIATTAAMVFEAAALSFTVWRKLGIVMAVFLPAAPAKEAY